MMAACFFGEMSYVKPPSSGVVKGMFVPKLVGQGATADAIALLGALVMPYNLFLHSALVLSRKVHNSVRGVNFLCHALFVRSDNLSGDNQNHCSNLNLNSASFLLQGKAQPSHITGTYVGQFIIQGFLNLKMRKWLKNLMTRCIAITPSLIVSIICGSQGAGRLIIIATVRKNLHMILSFELPFALIPPLKFSSSSIKMGPYKNSKIVRAFLPFILLFFLFS
ncbi:hypothetical protein GQ457_03G006930 [Hibiscus cannabinus]